MRYHQKAQLHLHLTVLCWDDGSRGLRSVGLMLGEVGWQRAAGKGLAWAPGLVVMVTVLGEAEMVVGDHPWWYHQRTSKRSTQSLNESGGKELGQKGSAQNTQ